MVAVQKVVVPDLEQNSDANEQVIQAKTQGTDKRVENSKAAATELQRETTYHHSHRYALL